VGSLEDFQTHDPNYTCFNGSSLQVYQGQASHPGYYVAHAWNPACGAHAAGTWLFSTYSGTWAQQLFSLAYVANFTPTGTPAGYLIDFQTSDPSYTCFNGSSVPVYTNQALAPGLLVAHAWNPACAPAPQAGTWVFNAYNGGWQGQTVDLSYVPNVTPTGASSGTLDNFQTSDTRYTCFNGASVPVYKSQASYPGFLVAHAFNPACAPGPQAGTWIFQSYSGDWNGSQVTLNYVPNFTPTGAAAGVLTGFQTSDPNYTCFNGSLLSVYTGQSETPGFLVAHAWNAACTPRAAGTWVFQAYTASSAGSTVGLNYVPNFTPIGNATGSVANFQTTDPNYTCFNGSALPVYTGTPEYPGLSVVHAWNPSCAPGPQAGTWVF
jgi:hypothetical protein